MNRHSTVVGAFPFDDHSMTIRLCGSMTLTITSSERLYISQAHVTCLPVSRRPLLRVNQKFVVVRGSTKASNTWSTGLRISISALATAVVASGAGIGSSLTTPRVSAGYPRDD